jgi:hypothetical protein
MGVTVAGEHIRIAREEYSGWKGRIPPSLTVATDRIIDMIPVLLVTEEESHKETIFSYD